MIYFYWLGANLLSPEVDKILLNGFVKIEMEAFQLLKLKGLHFQAISV